MSKRALFLTEPEVRSFRRALLRWYDQHRRDLPWRRDNDPYRVWVSEIMLQQTRVAAVLDHYTRFMRRFPTVHSLAAARESSVLAVWSGLGYYHRARRMHQAAKVILRERQGTFPRTAEEWVQLPGIGRYTAAAIASIGFGEAVAVVDGNVERVLQRLFGWKRPGRDCAGRAGLQASVQANYDCHSERDLARERPDFQAASGASSIAEVQTREAAWQQAEALLDRPRPGDFNQAMMELGATICTPRTPKCPLCPLNSFCESRGAGQPLSSVTRKSKDLGYALVLKPGSVLLVRRPANASLMANMWELPMLSADQANGNAPVMRLRHSITDTDYRVAVFAVSPDQLPCSGSAAKWFTPQQCQRQALTGLARKILRRTALASTRVLAVSN